MLDFIVVPLDLDSEESESLNKAINTFNRCQKSFSVDIHDKMHFFDEQVIVWSEVRDFLHNTNTNSRVIGVTSKSFNDNWFSHTEGRITAISIEDWRDRFSPPGLHCYLLLEFTLASYYHASDISENETNAHKDAIGCLHDACDDKDDVKWKLRMGYICSSHCDDFRKNGGNEKHLNSIMKLMDEVRNIALGRPQYTHSKESRRREFTLDWIKKQPIVVAAIIFATGIGIGWWAIWYVYLVPKNDRIAYLENSIPSKNTELTANPPLPTGKLDLSEQVTKYSISDNKKLPKLTLEIIPQISTESYEEKLNFLRDRKDLRSLTPFESDKKISELPSKTYFFVSSFFLSLSKYDELNKILEGTPVNRYNSNPSLYFECHIPKNGLPEIIGFVSDVQATDMSQLNGIEHKFLHLFPYPLDEAKTLIILPIERIIYSSYRDIELNESESLYVLDLTIR